jgi:hypothetical protein
MMRKLAGVGLMLVAVIVVPMSVVAEERDAKIHGISVLGECLTQVSQDRASVTVASTVVARTPKEASEQAVRAHEVLRAEIKKLQLKDSSAETAGYSVFEECSYPEGKKVCTGYRARLATRFETSEIGRIGEVIALASKGGAEEVSDLRTIISPQLMQQEREGCLELATRNAYAKAQKIAQGAGVRLGKLISVSEGGAGEPPVMPFPRGVAMESMMVKSVTPTIESKPEDVRVAVSAVYAIE